MPQRRCAWAAQSGRALRRALAACPWRRHPVGRLWWCRGSGDVRLRAAVGGEADM